MTRQGAKRNGQAYAGRAARLSLLFSVFCSLSSACSSLHAESYTFTTLAGSTGGPGSDDGPAASARFYSPAGVAVDAGGNIYVADQDNHAIRKITPGGVVTTLAGIAGVPGIPTNGPGAAARFNFPTDVALDGNGNVYVADYFSHAIRKISPAGVVSSLAGSGYGSNDGTGAAAKFSYPSSVAVDSSGNVYVADVDNHTIRKVSPAGVVTTLAGMAGMSGSADGLGSAARFNEPGGVAVDAGGTVYVADQNNSTIRKITPGGQVSTFAGAAASPGSLDGTGAAAQFYHPSRLALDTSGNLWVSDGYNHTIRKVTPGATVTTVAGLAQKEGSADGAGSAARFEFPAGLTVDSGGNVYVADVGNHTIRKITPAGVVSTLAGTAAISGSTDATGVAARFGGPECVSVNGGGTAYVSDSSTIRKVTPAAVVTTLAGTAGSQGSTDATGAAVRFYGLTGVALDNSGNIIGADTYNCTIRKVTPNGVSSTLAGVAESRGSADGAGAVARFFQPSAVAVDTGGNIYVADTQNNTIRKITAGGVVSTLAGTAGVQGSSDGTGAAAQFYFPQGVAVDASGTVYVADTYNQTIRKITPNGVVSTLAGSPGIVDVKDGTGAAARFNSPMGLAIDLSGNILVADYESCTIRKITPAGVVTTLAGTPVIAGNKSQGSADGTGAAAKFNLPKGVAVDGNGNIYVADLENHSIRIGRLALADIATIDLPTGVVGTTRQLDTAPQTATSWSWKLIRKPAGSTAALSNASIRNPTFTPDVADLFVFRLTATGPSGTSITTVNLSGTLVPAATATVAQNTGTAFSSSTQPVVLSATVTSASGTVNEGAVTFQIMNGATKIGSAVSPAVVNGSVNVEYFLPGGTALGTYSIVAAYGNATSFASSGDSSHTLRVSTAPVANSQSVNVPFNTATSITLSGTDPNNPALTPLTYEVIGTPSHGTLTGTAPNLTYTPSAGYNGADSFFFYVRNAGFALAATGGTVSLTIAAGKPAAIPQSVNVPFNTGVSIALTGSDPDAPALALQTYAVTSNPIHGTLSGTAPNLTYTPGAGYNGADSFQFTVTNSASVTSVPATISLVVSAGAPTANPQSLNVAFNTGAAITLSGSDPNTPAQALTFAVSTNPLRGTLSGSAPNLTYTPAAGFNGLDSFQFTATNTGNKTSSAATVSLTVAAGVPTAIAKSINVALNAPTSVLLAGTDPDVPPLALSYTVIANPIYGTLSGTAPNLIYTASSGYIGTDSFQFTITNSANNTSSAATISLTVTTGTPGADAQTVNVAFNTGAQITLTGSDPDVPALAISFALATNPAHGTLSGTVPNLTYTPANGYNGADSFQFTVTNSGNVTSSPGIVSIAVAAGIPSANGQTAAVTFNTPEALVLSGSDPDIPALALNYAVSTAPAHGSISGSGAAITYTPAHGYSGPDSFQFIATNSAGHASAPASVSLTIVNSPPVISSAPIALPQPSTVGQSVSFTAAATDPNNDPLAYSWSFGDGTSGTGASPSHIYALAGTYTAVVSIDDGYNPALSSSVSVTVNAAAPVVGSGADSDGDGYSDSFENALGSQPNNAASTPTGQPILAAGLKPLLISKASIKLNFAKGLSDTITFAGTLNIPAGFAAAGAKVCFDVGGVPKVFSLSSKGSAVSGGDSVKLGIKSVKGGVPAQAAKYTVTFKNGSFAAALADKGLANATVKTSAIVTFNFIFNNAVLQCTKPLSYLGKAGKSGAAKYP